MDISGFSAFIFDVDGTLIDSEKYHVAAFANAMKEMAGYTLTAQDRRDFSGNTSLWLAQHIAQREQLPIDPLQVTARKFEILYRDFQTELFPGAADFVRHWQGRKLLALASNSPLHFVQQALEAVDLFGCFDTVVTVDNVSRRKPDPEMLLLCLDRFGLSPADALVFEDTTIGTTAARAAGCPVVVLNNPGLVVPEELPRDIPVRSWPELLDCSHAGALSSPEEAR